MPSITRTSPLAEFLNQEDIEDSPAWEFLAGQAEQKPMPTLFHSRLQRNLVNLINDQAEGYEAIQELRFLVPPLSPVPDIAVMAVADIPDEDGPIEGPPEWLIEIRSPGQGTVKLQNKILHCLANGTKLAWLIDIQQQKVWVWQGGELPMIFAGAEVLPTLGLVQDLTVEAVIALSRQR